jgi:hypothetical protein
MTFNIIIITGVFFLIPGMTELLSNSTEALGNIIETQMYLDIQYKRNFVYTTSFFSILFLLTKMSILRYFFYILFLFSTYSYFVEIKKLQPNYHKLQPNYHIL